MKFYTVKELNEWWRKRQVDEDDVEMAAKTLMNEGFRESDSRLGSAVNSSNESDFLLYFTGDEFGHSIQAQGGQPGHPRRSAVCFYNVRRRNMYTILGVGEKFKHVYISFCGTRYFIGACFHMPLCRAWMRGLWFHRTVARIHIGSPTESKWYEVFQIGFVRVLLNLFWNFSLRTCKLSV